MQDKNQEKSILKQRLFEYLDYKGIKNKNDLYQPDNAGLSKGILSQNNKLSEDNILRFLNFYTDINLDWFIYGRGEMIKKDASLSDDSHILENEQLRNSIIRLVTENTQLRDEIEQLKNKKRAG